MSSQAPDPPQRATAAQMASRTIKSSKKGQRPGARPGAVKLITPHYLDAEPKFASMPSQAIPSNGANPLFGAIEASKSFNFTATGGPQWVPPAQETSNNDRSKNDQRGPQNPDAAQHTEPEGPPPNSIFTFGATATPPIPNTIPGSSFGSFGQGAFASAPAQATAVPTSNLFGSQPSYNPFAFGSQATPSALKPSFGGPSINIFGQASSTPAHVQATAAPTSNMFGSQPSKDPFVFGPQATPSALNPGFGGPSNNIFGQAPSTPAPVQAMAAPTSSFFPPSNTQAGAMGTPATFSFGQAAQAGASSTPFTFGGQGAIQTSATPAANQVISPSSNHSAMSIVTSPPANSAPTTDNMFGVSSATPQPANIFGSLNQHASTNMFASQASPKPSITGSSVSDAQSSASNGPNPFVNNNQVPAASSSLSDRITKPEDPSSATPASNSLFDRITRPAEPSPATPALNNISDPVSKPVEPSAQANPFPNIFSNASKLSATSSENQNGPAAESSAPVKSWANPFENKSSTSLTDQNVLASASDSDASKNVPPTSNLFGNSSLKAPSSSNIFANSSKPSSSNLFGGSSFKAAPSNNLFGNTKPTNLFASAHNRPSGGLTNGQDPSLKMYKEVDAVLHHIDRERENSTEEKDPDAPAESAVPCSFITMVAPNLYFDDNGDPDNYPRMFPGMYYASKYPIEKMENRVPSHFTPAQVEDFYVKYRFRELKRAHARYMAQVQDPNFNMVPALRYFETLRVKILSQTSTDIDRAAHNLKCKAQKACIQDKGNDSKRIKTTQAPTPHSDLVGNESRNGLPLKAANATATDDRPQSTVNGSSSQGPSFIPPQPAPRPASPNKRKGEELTKDDYESSEGSRPLKQAKVKDSTANAGSNTLHLFQQALDSPTKTSPRKVLPEKGTPSSRVFDDKPRFNPFANLPIPPSPSVGKPAAFKPAGSMIGLPNPSQTSSFEASIQKPDAMKAPFFGTPKTDVVKAPFFGAPQTDAVKAPVFGTPKTDVVKAPFFGAPQTDAVKAPFFGAPQPDVVKAPFFGAPKTDVVKAPFFGAPQPDAVKAPVFSAPANPFDIFKKQAEKDKVELEQKLMAKAKAEEYESDEESAAEWEAKYWKRREAAKKKMAEDGKKAQVPKFGVAKKPESQNLFGPAASTKSSAASVLSSANVSRSSTPARSIFDGVPSKPVGKNIFAHLSDSGGSAKVNNGDEESDDDQTEGESDSENKDPSYKYKPDEENKSGPGTPVTPVEHTGAGIASTKKVAGSGNFFGTPSQPSQALSSGTSTPVRSLFDRIAKDKDGNPIRVLPPSSSDGNSFGIPSQPPQALSSGTSTPVPSLFDRIAKDKDGNPIRVLPPSSSDEKENAQPPQNRNPFAFLNKPTGPTGDQLWKSDTPIKFGAATPTSDGNGAPSVVVQASTPTKTVNAFGNLFGNVKDGKPASFSGFGTSPASSSGAKPAGVGFGFGVGAASANSSLFPSVAGSTNTSRATTPGAITEGDEADPDGVHHQQIDLTAGGPGEEDEDVLHEVRAKVQKHNGAGWVLQGLGPLRVLRHKLTKATRILVRADPSGSILMNKALLAGDYKPSGKTVKIITAGDGTNPFDTYVAQVKTPEFAKTLAEVLQANKPEVN